MPIVELSKIILIFRNIKDQFSISQELSIILVIWLFFDSFNYLFFFVLELDILGNYQFLFVENIRNYALLLVCGFYPLYLSYYKNPVLPIITTRECAKNFNLLLLTEKTYNSFAKFLSNFSQDGSRLLSLWTDLNIFKHSSYMKSKSNVCSSDIFEKYINEYSEYYIDIPGDIINRIENSYLDISKNLYHPSYDELLDYVFNTLKDVYFPYFKNSEEYINLEKELKSEEIIYSRLLGSSVISNFEMI